MNLTWILLAVPVVSAAAFIWTKLRAVRQEPYHSCRCPDCGQKVRYLKSKAGRPGECPRCGQRWALPVTPGQLPQKRESFEEGRTGRRLWRSIRLTTASIPARRSR